VYEYGGENTRMDCHATLAMTKATMGMEEHEFEIRNF
jgi:hypothetical protein